MNLNMYRATDGVQPTAQRSKDANGNGKKRSVLSPASGAGKDALIPAKRKKKQDSKSGDSYCWLCHKDGQVVKCEACPRVYHSRCLGHDTNHEETWVCPECEKIVLSENVDTRSKAMKMLTVDQLCNLLKFAVARMKQQGDEAFSKPVSIEACPNYLERISVPMDLSSLEKNIKKKMYGCTESFLADTKWILHNCIIYNGYQHRLTSNAKQIVKTCRHEMSEIEACPDCYLNAYTKKENWFCEPCREPHLLIWSKLKGFPFWPAKVMQVVNGNIDVRFFGAHDRAWIPVNQCYLLSKDIPTPMKNKKKGSFEQSMEELDLHVKKLQERFGTFQYAPNRTAVDPDNFQKQVSVLLPQVDLKCRSSSLMAQAATKEHRHGGVSRSSNAVSRFSEFDISAVENSAIRPLRKEPNTVENCSSSDRLLTPRTRSVDSSKSITESVPPKSVLKSRECRKTLAVTIERLKENATEKSDDDVDGDEHDKNGGGTCKDTENVKILATSRDQNVLSIRDLMTINRTAEGSRFIGETSSGETEGPFHVFSVERSRASELCEVSSTTNTAVELNVNVTECEDLVTRANLQSSSSSLTPPKKSSVFVQKLDQTIESCKAKLGIEKVQEDIMPSEESSEEDTLEKNDTSKYVKAVEGKRSLERQDITSSDAEHDSDEHYDTNDAGQFACGGQKSALEISDISNVQVSVLSKDKVSCKKKNVERDNVFNEDNATREKDSPGTPDNVLASTQQQHKQCLIYKENRTNANNSDSPEGILSEENCGNNSTAAPTGRESFDLDMECSDEGELVIDLDTDTNENLHPMVSSPVQRTPPLKVRIKDGVHWTERKTSKVKSKSAHRESYTSAAKNGSSVKKSTSASYTPAEHHSSEQKSPDANKSSTASQIAPKPMPALQPRPPPPTLTVGTSPVPTSPGTGCDMTKYSRKMMDFMCGTVEEMFKDMAKSGNLEAAVKTLQLEIEKMAWRHQQELAEIKHNTDLVLLEMRASMESEKQRAISEARRQCDIEKQKVMEETKKKQWCANCGKEAILYCCWNTSYCDYPCQQAHWPQHMSTCAQSQNSNEGENVSGSSSTAVATTTTTTISALSTKPSTLMQRTVTIHQGSPNTPISPPAPSKREESHTTWQKKSRDDLIGIFKRQQEDREREKQRLHTQMPQQQPPVSQPSNLSAQYGGPLQYIPSNAVQVIPQTSSLANSSALQVQYVANLPSQGSRMSPASANLQQFAAMAGSAFPMQQGLSSQQQAGHRLLQQQQQQQQQQQRPLQMSNSMYPIIIQPGPPLGINQSNSSPTNARSSYPRGPYIPGKPYHIP